MNSPGARPFTARARAQDPAPTPRPASYELRAPDRAVAEATRGLTRSHDS